MITGQVGPVGRVGSVGRVRPVGLVSLLIVVGVLAFVRPAAADMCHGQPGPSGQIDLPVGAVMRTFVVRVPKTEPRTPAPVVFLFHPFGMNMQYMQGRVPLPRVWPEAIAIYGQGTPRSGGGGLQPSWQNSAGDADDRDVKYFDAMLEWVQKNHCVDPTRVFVMGYSNGANFASVLACARTAVIAGVAIASGSLSCAPAKALPVILSHGLSDATAPYARGVEAAAAWTRRNSCASPPKNGTPGCSAATACSMAPLVMCSYDGGHEYHDPFTKAFADFFKTITSAK